MKTFVVLSDSHGRCRKTIGNMGGLFAENDYIVHLGDGSADLRAVLSDYPEKTYLLRGNCDAAFGADEFVIEAEGISVLCCHGHRYGVKSGLSRLAARAKECGCRVYTQSHLDVIADALENIKERAGGIRGYRIVEEPPILRHFTAKLLPL